MDEAAYAAARSRMIAEQIRARGVRDPRVLEAMERVPRHLFIPSAERHEAYQDDPAAVYRGIHDGGAARRALPSRARDRRRIRISDRDPRRAWRDRLRH